MGRRVWRWFRAVFLTVLVIGLPRDQPTLTFGLITYFVIRRGDAIERRLDEQEND